MLSIISNDLSNRDENPNDTIDAESVFSFVHTPENILKFR